MHKQRSTSCFTFSNFFVFSSLFSKLPQNKILISHKIFNEKEQIDELERQNAPLSDDGSLVFVSIGANDLNALMNAKTGFFDKIHDLILDQV